MADLSTQQSFELEVSSSWKPWAIATVAAIVSDFWKTNEAATLGILKSAPNIATVENFVKNALWDAELVSSLNPTLRKTFQKGRKRVISGAGLVFDPDPTKPQAFLAQRGVKVTDHVEGIKRAVLDTFKAPGQNLTIAQLGEQLAPKLEHQFGIAKVRSRRIARTEVTAAFNGGMLDGMIESGQPWKQWINSGDALVRSSHEISEVVPTKEFFTLADGYQVMYPGDGDAAHAVNCRCTLQAISIDENTGEEVPIL